MTERTTLVAIGNGLYVRTRKLESMLDSWRRRKAACTHERRDPRGQCYQCGDEQKAQVVEVA